MIPRILIFLLLSSLLGMGAPTLHIAKRGMLVTGKGTAADPFNGSTAGRLQKIVDQAPEGATLEFAEGVFPLGVDIRKSLTLSGQGEKTILQTDRVGRDAIKFSGEASRLTVRNLQMRYTGGWGDASDVTEGILLASAADSIILDRVVFRDYYNCVYTAAPLRRLVVTNCQFLYSFGRAAVSNSPPFQHPAVAVLGSGVEETIVRDCYFDGLLDPTFHGVKGNPPKSQRTPMDGLYKTGGGNPKSTLVENNVVKNHGIEGILCERIDFQGEYTTRVRGNKVIGPAYKEHSFYGNYCPAIVIYNIQGAELSDNSIENSPLGIDVTFTKWAGSNACTIRDNAISKVVIGARITNGGNDTIFSHNRVFCSSEPTKSVHSPNIEWCGLVGVAASGTPVIRSNSFRAAEPAWDAQTKLLSRDKNLFEVSNAKGILPGQGVLISLSSQGLGYFPVQGISGKAITIAPQWAANQPSPSSGKLVYARKLGNFTELGAVCSFGATSKVVVENNRISGFLQDVASSNCGTILARENQATSVLSIPQPSHYFHREMPKAP